MRKHIKLFESYSIREEIEDCFLELTDTCYNFDLEDCSTGTVKLVGEIIGRNLSGYTKGAYLNGELIYDIKKHVGYEWVIIEDDTSQGLLPTMKNLSNDDAYLVMKEILSTMPSVLKKLKQFIDKKSKIVFEINIYGVERGTCIVVYIRY